MFIGCLDGGFEGSRVKKGGVYGGVGSTGGLDRTEWETLVDGMIGIMAW